MNWIIKCICVLFTFHWEAQINESVYNFQGQQANFITKCFLPSQIGANEIDAVRKTFNIHVLATQEGRRLLLLLIHRGSEVMTVNNICLLVVTAAKSHALVGTVTYSTSTIRISNSFSVLLMTFEHVALQIKQRKSESLTCRTMCWATQNLVQAGDDGHMTLSALSFTFLLPCRGLALPLGSAQTH